MAVGDMGALAKLVGMAGVVMVCFMLLSAGAITMWSTPRVAPRWAMLFAQLDAHESARPIQRRSAIVLAAIALAFELGLMYIALHPELLPAGFGPRYLRLVENHLPPHATEHHDSGVLLRTPTAPFAETDAGWRAPEELRVQVTGGPLSWDRMRATTVPDGL